MDPTLSQYLHLLHFRNYKPPGAEVHEDPYLVYCSNCREVASLFASHAPLLHTYCRRCGAHTGYIVDWSAATEENKC